MSGSLCARVLSLACLAWSLPGCDAFEERPTEQESADTSDREATPIPGDVCSACGLDCDCEAPGLFDGRAKLTSLPSLDAYFQLVVGFDHRAAVAGDRIALELAALARHLDSELGSETLPAVMHGLREAPVLELAEPDCAIDPELVRAHVLRCDPDVAPRDVVVGSDLSVDRVLATCARAAAAQVRFDVVCAPAARAAIEYDLAEDLPQDQHEAIVALLEGLPLRLASLEAALAKAQLVLDAADDLSVAATTDVGGLLQALTEEEVSLRGLFGIKCALNELSQVERLLADPIGRLQAEIDDARTLLAPLEIERVAAADESTP